MRTATGSHTRLAIAALLAIALAVAHVVAWAAGPSLGLIPDAAALVVAAVASVLNARLLAAK